MAERSIEEMAESVPSHTLTIYIAGDVDSARQVLNVMAHERGMCVTVTPTKFIYSGGSEDGMAIGIINYPRFPTTPESLDAFAEDIVECLMPLLNQRSASVVGPKITRTYVLKKSR